MFDEKEFLKDSPRGRGVPNLAQTSEWSVFSGTLAVDRYSRVQMMTPMTRAETRNTTQTNALIGVRKYHGSVVCPSFITMMPNPALFVAAEKCSPCSRRSTVGTKPEGAMSHEFVLSRCSISSQSRHCHSASQMIDYE